MAIKINNALVAVTPDDPAFEIRPSHWNQDFVWSGLTAGQILFPSDTTTLTSSANFVYSEASGPRLKVGTTGTSAGLIWGYYGSSGNAAIWPSSLTPDLNNYILRTDGTNTTLSASASNGGITFRVIGTQIAQFGGFGTAGLGPIFTAGTATTDVNALNITQTWNASGVTFTAEETNVTITASALGSLLRDWQVGGASKFAIGKRGNTISTASANNRAEAKPILYGATTDAATAVELTTDGAAGSGTTNRILVPADTTLSCVVNIAVKQSASASAKQMLRQFVISNNGGTTAIQGTVVTLGTDSGTAGLATVTCTITANDTDDAVKIEVNGLLATNLRFTAYVISTEVLYA